jgi:hypothetical protein
MAAKTDSRKPECEGKAGESSTAAASTNAKPMLVATVSIAIAVCNI